MTQDYKSYLLRPLDTLFFRSGQPFNAGEDHHVLSLFPPTPRTIQGIVRTRLLIEEKVAFNNNEASDVIERLVGNGDELAPGLAFKGPYPFQDEPCFPLPLYFVYDKGSGYRQLERRSGVFTDKGHDSSLPCLRGEVPGSGKSSWLPWSLMRRLLWNGNVSNTEHPKAENSLWNEEIRTGIARDHKKGTAREQHLYSIGHIRMNPWADGLWFQCTRGISQGIMAVGGEGRMASFEALGENDMDLRDDIAQAIIKEKQFWIILMQPARFENGYLPDFPMEPWASLGVECVMTVVGKPVPLGGFDLAKGRPANMYRYVPAGSSYLMEFKGRKINEEASDTLQALHNSCCLGDEKEQRMGFGHVMIGRVY